jgi:hypothetical protein
MKNTAAKLLRKKRLNALATFSWKSPIAGQI